MSTNINTNSLDGCTRCTKNVYYNSKSKSVVFREWLAGLVDGDGYFSSPKNGYNKFEITMDARDKKVLDLIKLKYGGSVKQISNGHAFKYKLRNKTRLIQLIKDINGLIRNPTRLLQINKLCIKFNINLKCSPNNLTFDNG
jgi:ubiquinol-cytochrome c reductase cytochrome b subunit